MFSVPKCILSNTNTQPTTKLSRAVDMLEGSVDIQRELYRLEKWAHEKLMKFNKAEHKILHLAQCNPI